MIINFIKIMYTLKKPFNAILFFFLLLTTLSACGGELTVEETISATLTWTPPTARMSGATLLSSEISSYRAYYGTSSGVYTLTKDVATSSCSSTCSTTISGLSGTYYFVVTATDTSGNESGYSNEVSKTF